jgi:hypothetical protein
MDHLFYSFSQQKHPIDMRETEIQDFFTHFAANRNIAASTQNQPREFALKC